MQNKENGTKLKRKHIGHKYLYFLSDGPSWPWTPARHPHSDRLVPTKTSRNKCYISIVGCWGARQPKHSGSSSRPPICLDPPFLPSMGSPHVHIKVPDSREGVVNHQATYNPAKIWTLFVRIISTIRFVLRPCLLDLEGLWTIRTDKPPWGYNRISPMLGLVMLVHGLSTCK